MRKSMGYMYVLGPIPIRFFDSPSLVLIYQDKYNSASG